MNSRPGCTVGGCYIPLVTKKKMIFTLPSCPGTSSLRTVGRWPRRWLHLHWCLDDGSCWAGLRFLTSAPESTPLVNGPPSARAGRFGTGCRRLVRWQVPRWLRGKGSGARFPRMNGIRKGTKQYEMVRLTNLDRTCHQLRICFSDTRGYRFR